MSDFTLDELRAELEEFSVPKKNAAANTPFQERVRAGFEDIERFFEQNGRPPVHGEDKDIFERLYAARAEAVKSNPEALEALKGLDKYGLLEDSAASGHIFTAELSNEELLAALGPAPTEDNDITVLKHVKPRSAGHPADEIARRSACLDFDDFKPLFIKVQKELNRGLRKTIKFKKNVQIGRGRFFILGGQKVYVAEVGEEIEDPDSKPNARLRVIYDNGTESNLLRRSFQRALYKDEAGRRITELSAGPLFSDEFEDGDTDSGTVYVLKSKSKHPIIKEHRKVIHKIGITGSELNKRLAGAKFDPTFLMAEVEVAATYKLSNINRGKLEKLIHKFFEPARLNIEIKDRFGTPIEPREWFLVPLFVIDETIQKIKDGTIVRYRYDAEESRIRLLEE